MSDKDKAIDLADVRKQVQERVQQEEDHLAGPDNDTPDKTGGPDDPRFVRACLKNNERGDGLLFCASHRDRYVYNKIQGRWYDWSGHYWQPDIMGQVVQGVEDVAMRYHLASEPISESLAEISAQLTELKAEIERCEKNNNDEGVIVAKARENALNKDKKKLESERSKLYRRVDQLRSKGRAEKALWWAHCVPGRLAVRGDEFDKKPLLLPCANGVIDLETGKLLRGNPKDLLVRAIPIEYHPGAESPDWRRFLPEIYMDDEDKANFIRRFLGYCLTGLTTEQIILTFLGDGANGKGTLFELIHYILGPLAWSINPELILEQKNPRPTAGPSADIVSLYGRRLVIASETDKNRRIGSANLKRFTGGDTLIGRSPHDKEETNFEPTHKMVLITNEAPLGLLADFSLQRRIRLIQHRLRYVKDVAAEQRKDQQNAEFYRQRNDDLPRLLREQAQGVLADLVRACLEYQRDGLTPPQSVIDDADDHRHSEDHLGRFVNSACTRVDGDPDYRIRLGDFYKAYVAWYKDEISDKDRYMPSKIAVGKELAKIGYHKEQKSGQTWIYGIKVPTEDGFVSY